MKINEYMDAMAPLINKCIDEHTVFGALGLMESITQILIYDIRTMRHHQISEAAQIKSAGHPTTTEMAGKFAPDVAPAPTEETPRECDDSVTGCGDK